MSIAAVVPALAWPSCLRLRRSWQRSGAQQVRRCPLCVPRCTRVRTAQAARQRTTPRTTWRLPRADMMMQGSKLQGAWRKVHGGGGPRLNNNNNDVNDHHQGQPGARGVNLPAARLQVCMHHLLPTSSALEARWRWCFSSPPCTVRQCVQQANHCVAPACTACGCDCGLPLNHAYWSHLGQSSTGPLRGESPLGGWVETVHAMRNAGRANVPSH